MSRPRLEQVGGRIEIRAGEDYDEHPVMGLVVNGHLILERQAHGGKRYRCALPLDLLMRLDNNHTYDLQGLTRMVGVK